MSNRKFFYKVPLIQMCLTLLFFLIGGFVFFILYCNRKSNVIVTYNQDENSIITDDRELYVTFSTPADKAWIEPDHTYGAQYDGKFVNNSKHVFTDWTITAKVPHGYWIDSNWNADFSFYYTENLPIPNSHSSYPEYRQQFKADEDYVVMKKIANNDGMAIMGKNMETFGPFMIGMIMYTKFPYKIRHITITGRYIYSPREYPIYYFLISGIILTTLCLFVLIAIQITVLKKVRFYEIRQKLDSDIIVQSFKTFANFVDAKDPYTKGHSLRVAHYAREVARRLKMTDHEQVEMFWLGLMHDVGKISVGDNILNKPARLTSDEFSEIQMHTTKGYEMLNDFSAMPMLKEVAKSHHEHWDGTGYPEHLRGQEIPLEARIVCVCDSFDAMNSDRCYRPRLEKEKIISEFEKCSGSHFDPKVARIMIDMIKDKSVERIENIDPRHNINYQA
ncbi:HD-GYP domain-containing protein [Treponema sp.]|uniref:HD-GYP domain-containing protein n=1 Tax=Treponema sp. TaxID=166 RepID=UPI00298EC2ED|nr:HD-GYP domain-containing protein [Treponema sp.]MCR5613141.1 HD-GYP domain-containing protein [Treponema sp.]